jgi:hypothetical protein
MRQHTVEIGDSQGHAFKMLIWTPSAWTKVKFWNSSDRYYDVTGGQLKKGTFALTVVMQFDVTTGMAKPVPTCTCTCRMKRIKGTPVLSSASTTIGAAQTMKVPASFLFAQNPPGD